MKKTILLLEYDLSDLTRVSVIPDGVGLDLWFRNYPHEDISVETKKWRTIKEFLEWYANQQEVLPK